MILLIYGYFAVVISKQFFPSDNETTSLLLAVGSFGISFLMRPLGAIVLGSYTDRAGRKCIVNDVDHDHADRHRNDYLRPDL